METEYASKGVAGSGLGLGIAGTALGLLNGGLSGILGGGRLAGAANDAAVLEMARKDSEIAQLKADAATDAKLVQVYTELRKQDKEQDAKFAAMEREIRTLDKQIGEVSLVASNGITTLNGAVAALQNTVAGITKTVVPITSVCPQPMPQYNSWTAPTTPTAG